MTFVKIFDDKTNKQIPGSVAFLNQSGTPFAKQSIGTAGAYLDEMNMGKASLIDVTASGYYNFSISKSQLAIENEFYLVKKPDLIGVGAAAAAGALLLVLFLKNN